MVGGITMGGVTTGGVTAQMEVTGTLTSSDQWSILKNNLIFVLESYI